MQTLILEVVKYVVKETFTITGLNDSLAFGRR